MSNPKTAKVRNCYMQMRKMHTQTQTHMRHTSTILWDQPVMMPRCQLLSSGKRVAHTCPRTIRSSGILYRSPISLYATLQCKVTLSHLAAIPTCSPSSYCHTLQSTKLQTSSVTPCSLPSYKQVASHLAAYQVTDR